LSAFASEVQRQQNDVGSLHDSLLHSTPSSVRLQLGLLILGQVNGMRDPHGFASYYGKHDPSLYVSIFLTHYTRCACCLLFMRTSGNNPFDRYRAKARASFASVFFTDRLITRN